MSIDRTRELFAGAVTAMAMDEGPLRARVRRARVGYLLRLGEGELPKNLRLAFGRLGSLIAPALDEQGVRIDLASLSDDDVRRASRLIIELNYQPNRTWRSPADQESAQASHERRPMESSSRCGDVERSGKGFHDGRPGNG